jgi:hypothetical protein
MFNTSSLALGSVSPRAFSYADHLKSKPRISYCKPFTEKDEKVPEKNYFDNLNCSTQVNIKVRVPINIRIGNKNKGSKARNFLNLNG